MSEDRGREQVNRRVAFALICLALLCPVLIFVNLCTGSTGITAADVMAILAGTAKDATAASIILQIRFPRAVAAMILGGALGLSGYLLQTFFRNPIAGPFVLGISSGAKLFVAVLMVTAVLYGRSFGAAAMILAALAGSAVATFFVILAARRVQNMAVLIVAGVMIGYICSAITELLVSFANDSNIVNLHNWSMGSFSSISWEQVRWFLPVILLGSGAAVFLSKGIEVYLYGENYARSVGMNVKVFRILLIAVSSLLSATVTAFAGPISFVGIAVPHLVRGLFRTASPRHMIPATFLCGSAFCLGCDLLARELFAPMELSISTITAIFGAPIVISLILKRKGR